MAHSTFLDVFGYECSGEGVEKLIAGQMVKPDGWAALMLQEYGPMSLRIIQDNLGLSSPAKRWEQKRKIYQEQNMFFDAH